MWHCPPELASIDNSILANLVMGRYNISGNTSSSGSSGGSGSTVGSSVGISSGSGGSGDTSMATFVAVGNSPHSQALMEYGTMDNCSGDYLDEDFNKFQSALSPTIDILVACYLLLLEVLAIVFNGLVIALSIWKRKSLKASDSFVVCLAISDVGHPIVSYPLIIASCFKHEWIFGETGCLWNGFTGFFFGVNSMMTLAMMSLNRLLIITNANFARRFGSFIACSLLLLSLAFALFWSLSPVLGWGEYGPEPYGTSCTLVWHEPDPSFVTASFIGCLAVPSLIMIFSYGKIVYLAAVMRHRRRKWSIRSQEWKIWEKNELRLLKVTWIMCMTFLLFWTPYAVVAMIKAYASHIHLPVELSVIPALTAKTSHVADPLIYCALNKNFSQHMPLLFRRSQKGGRSSETYFTTQSLKMRPLVVTEVKADGSFDGNSV